MACDCVVFAMLLACLGCGGIAEHDDSEPTSSGGADGSNADVSLGGTSGLGGNDAGGTDGDASDSGVCAPNEEHCVGGAPVTCSASGQWQISSPCPYLCTDGVCTGECQPGGTQCSGSTLESCDSQGIWQEATTCPFACSEGSCTGECVPGTTQCDGNGVKTCTENAVWSWTIACPDDKPACTSGACTEPPSCPDLPKACGAYGNESCCKSTLVPAGTFNRSNDPAFPASVSAFRLDKFEITVGRFRKFVQATTSGWKPTAGSGKHTHLNSGSGLTAHAGGYETGWDASHAVHLPDSKAAWDLALSGILSPPKSPCLAAAGSTWTPNPGPKENRPINCMSWYHVYAFCIWDGGFLPSEAEWNYAAAGGVEQRKYPWGANDVDCGYASYSGCEDGLVGCTLADIPVVGAKVWGNGKWGQADLAGGTAEWLLDWHASYVNPCVDCVQTSYSVGKGSEIRGGSFCFYPAEFLTTAWRHQSYPDAQYDVFGGRCARSP